jgi:hypothetical protein
LTDRLGEANRQFLQLLVSIAPKIKAIPKVLNIQQMEKRMAAKENT